MGCDSLNEALNNISPGTLNIISIIGTATGIISLFITILTFKNINKIKKELANKKIVNSNIKIIENHLNWLIAMSNAMGVGTDIRGDEIHRRIYDIITSLKECNLFKNPIVFIKYYGIKQQYKILEKCKYNDKEKTLDSLNQIYKYLKTIIEYLK